MVESFQDNSGIQDLVVPQKLSLKILNKADYTNSLFDFNLPNDY